MRRLIIALVAVGVAYAEGYDPAQLTASPSASASSSGG